METGPYSLIETLHHSPRWVLSRARRRRDGHVVLLKASGNHAGELEREFELLSSFASDSLPRPIEVFAANGATYVALEDQSLTGLPAILEAGRLSVEQALWLALGLCRALGLLHDRGLVHGLASPAAILVDPTVRRVVLWDLSLAQGPSIDAPGTSEAIFESGGAAFMAPEQTGRINRTVDHRADLYAAGATLYAALTGRPPFTPSDPLELIHAHIARMPIPPDALVQGIPDQLSRLVMRMLAKSADDRYQTTSGLAHDLERCLREWSATGRIDPFALGTRDRGAHLPIPSQLYGRDAARAVMTRAAARALAGRTTLLLVSGYSGVGKTSIVTEQCRELVRDGGYFVAGKFDLLARNLPYVGVIQALQSLLRQVLAEDDTQLARWRAALTAALGPSGGVVAAVVPEIEYILGPQPAAPPLEPTESIHRFRMTIEAVLTTFAQPDHPVVLFLDDLQWADSASLEFLHRLLTHNDDRPLLVVGAYRDNELTPEHPLQGALDRLEGAGAALERVTIGALDLPSLAAFLSDTLGIHDRDLDALAELVQQRTDGNPFFVIQFLEQLRANKLLTLDPAQRQWSYRLADIAAATTTEDVATLMTQRLQRLSPQSQRVLSTGACLGASFAVGTLRVAGDLEPEVADAGIAEAVRAGLLRPVLDTQADDMTDHAQHAVYAFLHDRVQQSAYDLTAREDLPQLHLAVGRRLRTHWGPDVPEDRLFDLMHHLNAGGDGVTDPTERFDVARLNLAAGQKAKMSGAYGAAMEYLQAGIRGLDEHGWTRHRDVTFPLHLELAECLALAGQFEPAERAQAALLARTTSRREAARVHELRVALYETQSRFAEAIAAGRDALGLFGLTLPTETEAIAAALAQERAQIDATLGARSIASILDAPVMANDDMRQAMRMLTLMWAPVYLSGDQPLTSLISAMMTRLSLEHGNTEDSAYGFVTHAMTVGPILRDFQKAFEWGELALAVNEHFGDTRRRAKIHQQIHAHVKLWRQPFEACLPHAREARRSGLENGDLTYAGYGAATESWPALPSHRRLDQFVRDFRPSLDFLIKVNLPGFRDAQAVLITWALTLQGTTASGTVLTSDLVDERQFVTRYDGRAPLFMSVLRWAKLHLCVLFDDIEGGVDAARLARATKVPGTMWPVLEEFWGAIALAAAWPTASDDQRQTSRAFIAAAEQSLREFAQSCPENFRCFWLLVSGERARIDGRFTDAAQAYTSAVGYADVTENVQMQALGNELSARFQMGLGRAGEAARLLQQAYAAYAAWGATAKLRHMEHRYGRAMLALDAAIAAPSPTAGPVPSSPAFSALDAHSVLQAAQAISSEVETDGLLRTLMTIALENAGASRGVFFRALDDRLHPLVEAFATSDGVDVRHVVPSASPGALAESVVRYVRRTGQDLALGDVALDDRFSGLAAGSAARAVLCVPVAQQGRLSGILYLENTLAETFTRARSDIVRVLAAQTAISLDNARLYDSMKGEIARRTSAEQALRDALAELQALKNRLEAENVYLREEIRTEHNFEEIVGNAPALIDALRMVERAAPTGSTVLIVGETGTGKELFARAVHNRSPRRGRPLVKVNCGAIAPGLVESELFGHVKGAFTGAIDKRIGRFELADGGTIFLDEIGELPQDAQVKILRVLQEHEFDPVGSSRTVKVDVRVIAATNRNLEDEVAAGRFRADLFYRLNVLQIRVPPLRDRRGDLPQLVAFFVQRHAKRIGRQVDGVSRESLTRLSDYDWPGNVRELENVIERALVLTSGGPLDVGPEIIGRLRAAPPRQSMPSTGLEGASSPAPQAARSGTLEEVERAHIANVLARTGWVIDGPRGAAFQLNLHPNTLRSRMKKLGLVRGAHGIS